jgi:hypothetical protein
VGSDSVSVKHRWCWATLSKGRFTRLSNVCVNYGFTFESNTTMTEDTPGVNAVADTGSSCRYMGTLLIVFMTRKNKKMLSFVTLETGKLVAPFQ